MSAILIVEDNEKNMKLVRDVLQFKGYQTLEAATGAEGLRLAREHKPDLVLMDIQLPDIDGITALGMLRADPATREMPVIAVSASVMPDEQRKISASGFNAYVTKPINVKGFIQTIERFVGAAKE
jgi:two-component system, cell cycle response regulator DivK